VGYAWHAWTVAPAANDGGPVAKHTAPLPSKPVVIEREERATANRSSFRVEEPAAGYQKSDARVAIVLPEDVEAANALRAAVAYGMEGVTPSVANASASNSTRGPSAAMVLPTDRRDAGEKEAPAFP
jgi:hypothetical protein